MSALEGEFLVGANLVEDVPVLLLQPSDLLHELILVEIELELRLDLVVEQSRVVVVRGAFGARGFSLNLNPMPLMNWSFGGGEMVDEKWRKQQILELEVYSKRLELVQDQIKAAMEELRSHGGGGL